jgi:hypothetical protein
MWVGGLSVNSGHVEACRCLAMFTIDLTLRLLSKVGHPLQGRTDQVKLRLGLVFRGAFRVP